MDREDIIEMARKVGFRTYTFEASTLSDLPERLTKFAELVAKHVRDNYSNEHANLWLRRIDEAVKAEREACAKVCKDADAEIADAEILAERILARGNG
jgi:hypothetical protein